MMSSRRFGAALLLVFSAGAALAQSTLEQLQKELVAPWLVTIEGGGDKRLLILRILGLAQKADGSFFVDATYGWIDGQPAPVRAELKQAGGQRRLQFITAAESVFEATGSGDRAFAGAVTERNRTPRPIRLEKLSEADLQMKMMAALATTITQTYSNEDKDWGVQPTATARRTDVHAPTPRSHPTAKVIHTMQLRSLLNANKSTVVIDVLGSKDRATVPGAYWMPGAGEGNFYSAEQRRLSAALEKLTGGDRNRPLVFLCISSECWLSYNAALRATEAGYTNVMWYRGGTNAWAAAGFQRNDVKPTSW